MGSGFVWQGEGPAQEPAILEVIWAETLVEKSVLAWGLLPQPLVGPAAVDAVPSGKIGVEAKRKVEAMWAAPRSAARLLGVPAQGW